jgi:hypothetical protein
MADDRTLRAAVRRGAPIHELRPRTPLLHRVPRRVLIAVVVAFLLLGAGGVSSPRALGPTAATAAPSATVTLGARATSDHFVVEARHQRVADAALALAEHAWSLLTPHFSQRPDGPVSIVIVESAAEYEAIQPAPMTRGFATFGGTRIFLRGDSVDQEVVTHELTHILFGLNVAPGLAIPDWFNEGLAQYTSRAPEATMQLIYDTSTNRLLTPQELGAVDALQGSNRDLATTEGLAVVGFLVDQYGDAKLWSLVDHLRTAKTFPQALLDTYGRTDLQLNATWMAYARRQFNFLSPLLLETLVTMLVAVLIVAAAAVWFVRRMRRPAIAGESDLTEAETAAAQQAELDLLGTPPYPAPVPPAIDTQDQAP